MKYAIQVSKDKAGYIALCREFPKFVATSKCLEDLSQLTVKNLSAIIKDCLAIDKGWSRDDFAGAMGLTLSSMNNFFDSEISTRLTTLDKAFRVLGLYPHLDIIESPGDLFLDYRESDAANRTQSPS